MGLVYALLGLSVIIALVGMGNTLTPLVFERTLELILSVLLTPQCRECRIKITWAAVIIWRSMTGNVAVR